MLVVINSTGVLVQTSRRIAACIVAFACSEMIAYWRPWPRAGLEREGQMLQLSGPPYSCDTCCLCKFTIGRTSSLPLVNDTRAPIPVRHTCLVP